MKVSIEDNTNAFKEEMAHKVHLVLEAIGDQIEGEAQEELQNDPRRVDTGNLRNSITHIVQDEEDAVYIGTNVEYGVYVHEGTGIYAEGGGGRTTPWVYKDEKGDWHVTRGMRPNRFLKNAVEKNEAQISKLIEDELKS